MLSMIILKHSLTPKFSMHINTSIITFLLVSCLCFDFTSPAADSITASKVLKYPETLISKNAYFKLGFFSPTNSTSRYLGIWHNNKNNPDSISEIVWVANRDNPVKDSSPKLEISVDGNLQIVDTENQSYWSSNVSSKGNSPVAQLLDTSNQIWQSFDYPTDSFLPGVKLLFNKSV